MTDPIEAAAAAVARTVLRNPDGVNWVKLRDGLSKRSRPDTAAAVELATGFGWIERHPGKGFLPGPRHNEVPAYEQFAAPGHRRGPGRIDCPGGCGKRVAVLFNGRISVHDHPYPRRLCPASGTRPDDAA